MQTLRIVGTRFLTIGFIAFILNAIWEFSHHSLYVDLSGIPKYTHLIIASFVDLFIILVIFAVVSFKNKSTRWIENASKFDYLIITLLGLVVAVIIETINLNLGRWEYTVAMPTLFGIGVSPLVQLALTGIASLSINKFIKK